MDYIRQIKGFWLTQEVNQLGISEIAFYFYLLEVWNKTGWTGTFKRNNYKVMADLSIKSYKTLQSVRDKLKAAGVLSFVQRNGDANTEYRMLDLGNFYQGLGKGSCEGIEPLGKKYQGLGEGLGKGLGQGSGEGSGVVNKTNTKTKQKQFEGDTPAPAGSENAPVNTEQPAPPPVSPTPQRNPEQFPTADCEMVLADSEIGGAVEYVRITKKLVFSPFQVSDLFQAFKIQNFTGKKFYESRSDVIKHFRDWLKFQKIEQNATVKATPPKITGAIDYAGGI